MFKETFYLTYIDLDGKREIYAPTRDLNEAIEWTKTRFEQKRAKSPEHQFKFKIKSSQQGWLKLEL